MFKGHNTIQMNEATIKEAIQYWFDKVMYREGASPTVKTVKPQRGTDTGFDIGVEEPTKDYKNAIQT